MEKIFKIGVIGYGIRSDAALSSYPDVVSRHKVVAIVDPNVQKAKERLIKIGTDPSEIKWYETAGDMLEKEKLDGVFIGTRCDLHAEYAMMVIKMGIPLFLEKPVAIDEMSLLELENINNTYKTPVMVSFPLRVTSIIKKVKEIVDSGMLGSIVQVQAINNVPYGRVYYHDWYRNANITGGLFLQKATHDIDYINYILGDKPLSVCAMSSTQIYKGTKPNDLMCQNCDEQNTCLESPLNLAKINESPDVGGYCCFVNASNNQDNGSMLIKYESGLHVAYSQNFIARKNAAKRGAIFTGYKGSLEFDFYKEEINVHLHNSNRTKHYKFDCKGQRHWGGDIELMRYFYEMIEKNSSKKITLESGILSAKICLAAELSSKNDSFIKIK